MRNPIIRYLYTLVVQHEKWGYIWKIFLTILVIIAADIVVPLFVAQFFDALELGMEHREQGILLARQAIVGAGITTAVAFVLERIQYWLHHSVVINTLERFQNEVLQRVMAHSHRFFINQKIGALISQMTRTRDIFFDLNWIIVHSIPQFLVVYFASLVVLFWHSAVVGLLFLGWSGVFVGLLWWIKKPFYRWSLRVNRQKSKVDGSLADIITNVFAVKSFSRSSEEQAVYAGQVREEAVSRWYAWGWGQGMESIQDLLGYGLQILILVVSLSLWSSGTITIGTIVLIQTYALKLNRSLASFGQDVKNFEKALSSGVELVEIMESPVEVLDPPTPEPCHITRGEISLENLSFAYTDEGKAVFHQLDLHIPAGQRVGIVGQSGSGKSTLTKLLLRFMDPQSGAITIDGQNIAHLTQDDLRRHISYVPQESLLFHRSVRENIAYGRPDATDEEVITAAKKAHAHEFITQLPRGYETLVGERGVKLSGGERQRVAIARAMLKQAPLLILDEATSSLDTVSEQYIQQSFTALMEGRTTLVIAHRLSTIMQMDRIIVLRRGEVVEEGRHEELLALGGVYAELCAHQQGGMIGIEPEEDER
ncbi:ABC transporter ATP-binding protein [Candidatus Peribacteria bacterium]|nr:ABC transporter ATP-binding protein [Candidatus Peribacteria bacterium]